MVLVISPGENFMENVNAYFVEQDLVLKKIIGSAGSYHAYILAKQLKKIDL